MNRLAALCLALALALGIAMVAGRPPSPRPAEAPPEVFSAGRAMTDVAVIAREAHPIGSAANARARDYILARMTALGLAPQVQADFSLRRVTRVAQPVFLGGRVENIVGVLPGRDRTAPALAIMAHYDSVPGSPGAADDAAGVAAALEVARILKARGTPARDIVFLMTDGEEGGLLGAESFFARHPLAGRIGFLVNLEARGGGGLVQMFQTGARNQGTVDLLAAAASQPSASSLSVLLYSAMPNDTDFTVSRAARIDGLNFAFIGRQFDYHAATSTPANLDRGSLQHMGDQVTAIALALSQANPLPPKGPDRVFSHVFGDLLIAYPAHLGWALLLIAGGLLALAVRNARRNGLIDAPGVVRGVGAAVYLLLLSGALLHLARKIAAEGGGFLEQRPLLARVSVWETALLLIGIGALVLAPRLTARGRSRLQAGALALAAGAAALPLGWDIAAIALGVAAAVAGVMTFGPPVRTAPAWTGVLLTALAVAVLLQVAAPAAAFLVAWPLLAACGLAALTTLGAGRREWLLLVAGVLVAAPVTAWLLGYAHGVFLGLDLPALLALFTWLSALCLWPLAHAAQDDPKADLRTTLAAAGAIAAGLALSGFLRLTPPWTERHPQATIVQHLQDAQTGDGLLISTEPRLSRWTRGVLARDGGRPSKDQDELVSRSPFWAASSRPAALPATATEFTRLEGERRKLVVRAPEGAAGLSLDLRSNTPATAVTVNGRPARLLAGPGLWNRLRLQAPPGELVIEFLPAGPGALEVRSLARLETWPKALAPLPARSPREMAFGDSDTALVRAETTYRW